jgi:hypothetical protein
MRKRISKLVLKRETIADLNLVAGGIMTNGCPSAIPCGGGGTVDTTFTGGTASQGQSCAVSGCTQPH